MAWEDEKFLLFSLFFFNENLSLLDGTFHDFTLYHFTTYIVKSRFSLLFDTCLPMNMNDDIFARFSGKLASWQTSEVSKKTTHTQKSTGSINKRFWQHCVARILCSVWMLLAYQTSKQFNLFDDIKATAAFYQKQIGKPTDFCVCMSVCMYACVFAVNRTGLCVYWFYWNGVGCVIAW